MYRCIVLLMTCLAGVPLAAHAQEAPAVERIPLALTPAGEARPALQYSLWRDPRDRQPGNAATYYYRAILLMKSGRETSEFPDDKTATWMTTPLEDFPAADVARYLELNKSVLRELGTATSRESCEWDLRLEQLQGTEVVSLLLHDFQGMRDLARIVAYKARYEVSQGHHDDAIQTLQMGYQMAHDSAEPPLLINALIGMAIAAQMHVAVLDLIQAPAAPNMYWALKQLPHPLVDMRPSLRFEMSIPYRVFPYLSDAETAERTPEEWQRLTQETLVNLNSLAGSVGETRLNDWQLRLGATAMLMKAYPIAKQQLVASGRDKEAVEKMSVAQVVAIHASRNYRYTYDEVFKWSLLPFPEAHLRMRESMEQLKADGYVGKPFSDKDVLPIASLLMPAIDSVLLASARSERRLATLETIEAIRLHAAARKGELPSSLDQLAIAPAPVNPFTGRSFDYHRDGNRAVLEERAPGFDPVRANDRIYMIELIKQVK